MTTLILVSGLPGTQRTPLAARLARERGYALLAKDTITHSLASADVVGKFAAYTVMFGLAALNLGNGLSVVLDGSFSLPRTRTQARTVAEAHGATFVAVSCICSDTAQWQAALTAHPPQAEGWAADFTSIEKMQKRYYPWKGPHLLLDAVQSVDESYQTLLTYLAALV